MKKVLFSCLAAALCLSANASETAKVTIELLSTNATYGTDVLELRENTDRNSTYESGYDSESMMSQANKHSVLLYGFVEDRPCSYVATDNLDGLAIGFTTNKYDVDYTLSFSGVSGRELKLYDRFMNTETVITEGGTYGFTATAGRVAVTDRFFINLNASDFNISLTTNDYGWASYSNTANLQVLAPAGLKIYTGAFDGVQTLNLTEVDYVKADQGVVVYGEPNTTYYFAAGTGSSVYGTNHLKPASDFDPSNYSNVFVLHGDALYEYVGTDAIPANKAYLQLPGGPSAAPRRISMHIDGTTAIENVEVAAPVEKFMENGQVLIKRGEAVYNLQGQMVK